jgi:hypothetical protein
MTATLIKFTEEEYTQLLHGVRSLGVQHKTRYTIEEYIKIKLFEREKE